MKERKEARSFRRFPPNEREEEGRERTIETDEAKGSSIQYTHDSSSMCPPPASFLARFRGEERRGENALFLHFLMSLLEHLPEEEALDY